MNGRTGGQTTRLVILLIYLHYIYVHITAYIYRLVLDVTNYRYMNKTIILCNNMLRAYKKPRLLQIKKIVEDEAGLPQFGIRKIKLRDSGIKCE